MKAPRAASSPGGHGRRGGQRFDRRCVVLQGYGDMGLEVEHVRRFKEDNLDRAIREILGGAAGSSGCAAAGSTEGASGATEGAAGPLSSLSSSSSPSPTPPLSPLAIGGTCLVTGLLGPFASASDAFVFEQLHGLGIFDKIVALAPDAAVARKRMTGRSARSSGLLGLLRFWEGDVEDLAEAATAATADKGGNVEEQDGPSGALFSQVDCWVGFAAPPTSHVTGPGDGRASSDSSRGTNGGTSDSGGSGGEGGGSLAAQCRAAARAGVKRAVLVCAAPCVSQGDLAAARAAFDGTTTQATFLQVRYRFRRGGGGGGGGESAGTARTRGGVFYFISRGGYRWASD